MYQSIMGPSSSSGADQTMQSMTHRTLSGLFWMFSGTGVQATLQVLVLGILARLLTPADFGLSSAALVVVGFSTTFSQLGIGPAVVQRAHLEDRHLRTGFTVSVLFSMALAGSVFLLAPNFAGLFRLEDLAPVLRVMSFVFLFQGPSVVAESLLQRGLRFRSLAGVNVVTYAVGYGGVGIALAVQGFGVWALVGAHLAQMVLKTVILLVACPHPMRPLLERRAFKELMYFGGGFTVGQIANYVAGQGDNLIVSRWLGAQALGLYGRAYQLMAMPATLLGEILDKVLFPAMAKVQNEKERLALAYRRGVAVIGLIVLPVSAVIFVLAPEVIDVLLGPAWEDVVLPLRILTVGMLFRTSHKISESLARATGVVYNRAWRQGVYATLVVGGAWVGQHWGIVGVAVGVLGALTVNFLLMAQLGLRITSLSWRDFGGMHFSGVLLALVSILEVWGIASLLRGLFAPSLVTLLVSGLALLTIWVLLAYLNLDLVLGQDVRWIIEVLFLYLPEKCRVIVGRYVLRERTL